MTTWHTSHMSQWQCSRRQKPSCTPHALAGPTHDYHPVPGAWDAACWGPAAYATQGRGHSALRGRYHGTRWTPPTPCPGAVRDYMGEGGDFGWGNFRQLHPFFFGPDQDELAYPAHHMVLETPSRNQGSELSSATMIPQMTAGAGLTRNFGTPTCWCLVQSREPQLQVLGIHSGYTKKNLLGSTMGSQNHSLGYTGHTRKKFWDTH